jgi:3-oxoacyl-[acyl-carrier protein] reductase
VSDQELKDSVAMVTGGARGIGLSIAKELGAAGAIVAICDLPESADEAVAAIPSGAAYFRCDVTDRESVDATVSAIVERFKHLDILINNAGIAIDGLILRTRPEQWAKVLDVNLNGAFYCLRAAARHLLKARQKGRVVNISSVVGEAGNPGQVSYSASKAALLGVTRTLALEFATRGITVNAVAPGFIETQMTAEHIQGEARDKLLSSIPMGRMGQPEDVAAAVRYLCSPAAGYVTGQVIRVNGGLYM